MPLVNTNPAMKTSFGGIGMLLFRPNGRATISPPSVLGGVGLYSTNSSYVFGGVGTVWGGESQSEEDVFERGLLPSVGAGIRYTLSGDKRINARIDYALGVNGNDGLYLGIMEAF